jgi:hypothetical protein
VQSSGSIEVHGASDVKLNYLVKGVRRGYANFSTIHSLASRLWSSQRPAMKSA